MNKIVINPTEFFNPQNYTTKLQLYKMGVIPEDAIAPINELDLNSAPGSEGLPAILLKTTKLNH